MSINTSNLKRTTEEIDALISRYDPQIRRFAKAYCYEWRRRLKTSMISEEDFLQECYCAFIKYVQTHEINDKVKHLPLTMKGGIRSYMMENSVVHCGSTKYFSRATKEYHFVSYELLDGALDEKAETFFMRIEEQAEAKKIVNHLFAVADEKERTVLRCKLKGLSVRETAAVMGCNKETVMRIQKKMQKKIKNFS